MKASYSLILVATDESGHQAALSVIVGVDNVPDWYSTGTFVVDREVLGSGKYYTAILIIPSDQESWENHPAFAQTLYIGSQEFHYTIVSADAQNPNPLPSGFGNLVKYSPPEAINMFEGRLAIGDISIAGNDEFSLISNILGSASSYNDNLSYHINPEENPGFYNSNSYIHGLIAAATYIRPDISFGGWVEVVSHPRWGTPVPLEEFGL